MSGIDETMDAATALDLPYCETCGRWYVARQQFCAAHPDRALGRRRLSGHGEIYSFTVSHVAMSHSVDDMTPYTTVLVATNEGPRLLAHFTEDREPRIGESVVLVEADPDMAPLPGTGRRVARPVEAVAR